ncbi:small ribosomal subunit protein uS9m isoform X2 [Anabrus simplex]|uniref:small ribosomal subunit protein uS9m isoform X2 n=1 Tax=Anabrus simplex TaxID=316456 RepID=UPI0035A3A42B
MSVNINYFKILGTKNSHFLFSRFLAVSKFQTGKSALRYLSDDVWEDGEKKVAKKTNISKAMKAYLERAQQYDEFIRKEKTEYQIGKRHLANMMGEDPEMFTQEDVDRAIEYLFPSGLYEPKARPLMKPPEEVFPPKKAAEFDSSGRPYHFLFYTGRPNFFQLMFDAVSHMNALNDFEDKMIRKHIKPDPSQALDLSGSEWTPKEDLEVKIVERLHDADYKNFLSVMDRLASHPYAHRAKDFILAYRKHLIAQTAIQDIPKPEYDAQGRAFVTIKNCLRKAARAEVTVRSPGTGKISINGKGIEYFEGVQPREQVLFPLIFTGLLDKVDVEASVHSGGFSGQAGAIRWGIASCLRSFVDEQMLERMRLAGLLTRDYRKRERKKPGQAGARKKFTWKKR